jgi:hypothetical protein
VPCRMIPRKSQARRYSCGSCPLRSARASLISYGSDNTRRDCTHRSMGGGLHDLLRPSAKIIHFLSHFITPW